MITTINEEMLKINEAINYLLLPGITLKDLEMIFKSMQINHPNLFDVFVDRFWTAVSHKGGIL